MLDEWDYSDYLTENTVLSPDEIDNQSNILEARADTVFRHKEHDHYLISSALNNTPIVPEALASMKVYAEFLKAQIIVGTERYHNAYSRHKNEEYETRIEWDKKLEDYLVDWQVDLFGDGKVLFDGQLRQRATILNPLNIYTNTRKEPLRILPSAKLHAKSVPRSVSQPYPAYLATTGTLTPFDYSHTRTGYRSSQVSKLGFLHVYRCDYGYFAFRQVEVAEDGSFYDLGFYVTTEGVYEHDAVELIMLPDSHVETMREDVKKGMFDLVEEFRPDHVMINDLISWEYGHHKTPFDHYLHPIKNLTHGLDTAKDFLDQLSKYSQITVLDSNHHYHLDIAIEKFLSKGESNAAYWKDLVKLSALKLDNPEKTTLESYLDPDGLYQWTTPSEELVIGGVTQFHGHHGINGSRGSPSQFKTLTTPINHGHNHNGYRLDNIMGVGVSGYNSDLSYSNKGFTNWTISAIMQFQNGSRQLIHFINGSWY